MSIGWLLGICPSVIIVVHGLPEIVTSQAAVGPEGGSQWLELLGCWNGLAVIGLSISSSDSQVAGCPNVQTMQRKDQEHLRSPLTDAANLSQLLDHVVVFFATDDRQIDSAIVHVSRQVA